jgi:hypothetical protein
MTHELPTTKRKRGATTPKDKQQLNVAISQQARAILDGVLARDGVPYTAQVERALLLWAAHKGIEVSHDRRKGAV